MNVKFQYRNGSYLMPTREEIREGIKLYAAGICIYQDGSYPCPIAGLGINSEMCLDCLVKKLDKLGIVIKVDRELPLVTEADVVEWSEAVKNGIKVCQHLMLKAGYTAWEPLIGEK